MVAAVVAGGADNRSVRVRRLQRGWTMKELARQCKAAGAAVSVSEISRIERGIYVPRPALRKALAHVLDLAVTDFD